MMATPGLVVATAPFTLVLTRMRGQTTMGPPLITQILHCMTLMFKTEAVSGGGFPRWGSQSWLPPRFYAAPGRLKAGCRLKVCPTNSENQ
jgi:hypothetical protein